GRARARPAAKVDGERPPAPEPATRRYHVSQSPPPPAAAPEGGTDETSAPRRRFDSLRARGLVGPTAAERRQALAGQASADAAHAQLEADTAPAAPEAPATPDLTAAAFFDVDNTLVHGASIIHFARGLAARDYIAVSDMAQFGWQQLKFRVTGRE